MALLPATGTEIVMGKVRKAYNNVAAAAGQNISLRDTLGAQIGQSTGAITLSSTFGGRTTPYTH